MPALHCWTSSKSILIAVLSFNEEANIERTLEDLKEHNFGYDVVVIDDGSNDRTGRICQRMGVPVVSHCINSGNYSNAAMTYFLYAYRNGYDVLCQFDGDGQHTASELPKILGPVLEGLADVVIGSRFLQQAGFKSFFARRMGIRLFSWIDSRVLGHPLTDVTSGFRSYSRKMIEFFGHHYKQELYDNTSQFLLTAHFIGARIEEVSTVMRPRQAGKSLFSPWKAATFPLKGALAILGCLLERGSLRKKAREYEL
jgi:glycosyltransferase involved in cell wall biosynthesis